MVNPHNYSLPILSKNICKRDFYALQHIHVCYSAYIYSNSVCPCLSHACLLLCVKTAERIIKILSPSDRPITIVFRHQGSLRKSGGFTPTGGQIQVGVAIFDQYAAISRLYLEHNGTVIVLACIPFINIISWHAVLFGSSSSSSSIKCVHLSNLEHAVECIVSYWPPWPTGQVSSYRSIKFHIFVSRVVNNSHNLNDRGCKCKRGYRSFVKFHFPRGTGLDRSAVTREYFLLASARAVS